MHNQGLWNKIELKTKVTIRQFNTINRIIGPIPSSKNSPSRQGTFVITIKIQLSEIFMTLKMKCENRNMTINIYHKK